MHSQTLSVVEDPGITREYTRVSPRTAFDPSSFATVSLKGPM